MLEEAPNALCEPALRQAKLGALGSLHRGHELPGDHVRCQWATRQIGDGRTVKEVPAELACDWHTVDRTVACPKTVRGR